MALIALILAILVFFFIWSNINRIKGLPPGPTPWPIIGNSLSINYSNIEKTLLQYKKQYGSVFTIWLPHPTVVVADYAGPYGLLYERNDWVKSQRKFTLSLLRDLGMGKQKSEAIILEQAQLTCEMMRKDMKSVDMKHILTIAVSNIMDKLSFGCQKDQNDPNLLYFQNNAIDFLKYYNNPIMNLLDVIPALKYLDGVLDLGINKCKISRDKLADYISKITYEHKNAIDYHSAPSCFLDAFLIEMNQRDSKDEEEFVENQLLMAIMGFYIGGYETIVSTLLFAFHFLINYPETQQKIHEEIDNTIGRSQSIRMEDLKKMPYVAAFIQETYRLGYVISFNFLRITMKEVNCEGYRLPMGTQVLPQVVTAHIDEAEYERPEYFSPERHLKDEKFVRDDRVNPFSVGKRSCPGESLARMEVFLFFVTCLQQFKFKHTGVIPPMHDPILRTIRAPKPFTMEITPFPCK